MQDITAAKESFVCSGRMTRNPHLTRRWPFGRVTEGLPTIQEYRLVARIEMPNATTSMVASYGHMALN
jgi:hypothetical protein